MVRLTIHNEFINKIRKQTLDINHRIYSSIPYARKLASVIPLSAAGELVVGPLRAA